MARITVPVTRWHRCSQLLCTGRHLHRHAAELGCTLPPSASAPAGPQPRLRPCTAAAESPLPQNETTCPAPPPPQSKPLRHNSSPVPLLATGTAAAAAAAAASTSLPWQISSYYTKKKERKTDELGRILQGPETIMEPLSWTEGAKLQLAVQAVAREEGLPEGEVLARAQQLQLLLPDLGTELANMKLADVVRLAVQVDGVAAKLLVLKELLPAANISKMVAASPRLLLAPVAELQQQCQQAVQLLGGPGAAGRVLEQVPGLMDPCALAAVLQEMQRLFGSSQQSPAERLVANPSLAHFCQSLRHQSRGDRDEEYLAR